MSETREQEIERHLEADMRAIRGIILDAVSRERERIREKVKAQIQPTNVNDYNEALEDVLAAIEGED